MIKNIIFDVGKVLVEWDPAAAFEALGFDPGTAEAVAEATVRSADWNEFDRSVLTDEEQLAFFIGKAPRYEREIRLFWENIGMAIRQFPYAKSWIAGLKQSGYRIYILSNYARWTYEHTREALSFTEEADGALFSFQVRQIKPEPEIYRTLLERYRLAAEECIFIDDRRENLDTAEALGIRGIQFKTYEEAVLALREAGVNS